MKPDRSFLSNSLPGDDFTGLLPCFLCLLSPVFWGVLCPAKSSISTHNVTAAEEHTVPVKVRPFTRLLCTAASQQEGPGFDSRMVHCSGCLPGLYVWSSYMFSHVHICFFYIYPNIKTCMIALLTLAQSARTWPPDATDVAKHCPWKPWESGQQDG